VMASGIKFVSIVDKLYSIIHLLEKTRNTGRFVTIRLRSYKKSIVSAYLAKEQGKLIFVTQIFVSHITITVRLEAEFLFQVSAFPL
jgi:hypothetical protein